MCLCLIFLSIFLFLILFHSVSLCWSLSVPMCISLRSFSVGRSVFLILHLSLCLRLSICLSPYEHPCVRLPLSLCMSVFLSVNPNSLFLCVCHQQSMYVLACLLFLSCTQSVALYISLTVSPSVYLPSCDAIGLSLQRTLTLSVSIQLPTCANTHTHSFHKCVFYT